MLLLLFPVDGQPDSQMEGPLRLPARVQEDNGGACPSDQDRSTVHDEILRNISVIFNCGGTQGWRRVGYLDMTDPSQSCPSGLALKYYSPGMRMCGRATNDTAGCWSTFYSTGGYYVEGVSLTHGQSGNRTHIWSFTSGLSEVYGGRWQTEFCQCAVASAPQSPPFVGNDYFCESGLHTPHHAAPAYWVIFPDDPLWDGQNCVSSSSCCQFNNPPYFTKTLPAPTGDDIELRICAEEYYVHSDSPIDQVELYVQ